VFLRWLALNSALENWDTYGGMAHNYYLYDDPDTGRLTWIGWDHDRILSAGGGMGGPGGGGFDMADMAQAGQPGGGAEPPAGFEGFRQGAPGMPEGFEGREALGPGGGGGFGGVGGVGGVGVFGGFGSTSLDRADTSDSWPLIRYLLDDPVYRAAYLAQLADLESNVFDVGAILERSAHYQALLEPYFTGDALASLQSAIAVLNERIESAGAALSAFVDESGAR